MFDNSEEDKDLASQVSKGASSSSTDEPDRDVIGSPVTPEKLDFKDPGSKLAAVASTTENFEGSTATKTSTSEGGNAAKGAAKKV